MSQPLYDQSNPVVGASERGLHRLQQAGACHSCNLAMEKGVRVIGQVVTRQGPGYLASNFQAICLCCGGLN